MPFQVPQFNLFCSVWHGQSYPPVGLPDISLLPCQLAWDRSMDKPFAVGVNVHSLMKLRVPPGSDIRGRWSTTGSDLVECPAGSGRYYMLHLVDDVAKGFANEYRQGLAQQVAQPTPLT